mgnify:CR=1 FL=1
MGREREDIAQFKIRKTLFFPKVGITHPIGDKSIQNSKLELFFLNFELFNSGFRLSGGELLLVNLVLIFFQRKQCCIPPSGRHNPSG